MNHTQSKHLLLGLMLGGVIATAVAATVSGPAVVGRFQLGATHDHVFVIDTQSGEVWKDQDAEFSQPKAKVPKF